MVRFQFTDASVNGLVSPAPEACAVARHVADPGNGIWPPATQACEAADFGDMISITKIAGVWSEADFMGST